jgi:hypothetical protein
MPIDRGGGRRGSGIGPIGVPWDRYGRGKPFRSRNFSTSPAMIRGVTRNSTGVVLGACTVQLFRTLDDSFQGEVLSDAVTGEYAIWGPVGGPYYIVAYLAGAPDVAGTTVNTLLPS